MVIDDLVGQHGSDWWTVSYLRRIGVVVGEGYPVLVGIAEAAERGGTRKLAIWGFIRPGTGFLELRMSTLLDTNLMVKRSIDVKVGGHTLCSTESSQQSDIRTSLVCRLSDLQVPLIDLLKHGERIDITWTDTLVDDTGSILDNGMAIFPATGFVQALRRIEGRMMQLGISAP